MQFKIKVFGLFWIIIDVLDIDFTDGDIGIGLKISWKEPER